MARTPRRNANCQRADSTSPSATRPKSKKEKLVVLLRMKDGQLLTELTTAQGWPPDTVRAAIAGLRKHGLNVERFAAENGRSRYPILSEAVQ